MATPEEGGKVLSAEQRTDPACDGSLPLGKERRMAHSRLLELLQAAASIMAELHHEEERWTEVQRSHVETKFPPPFPTKREPLWYSPRLRPPSCQNPGGSRSGGERAHSGKKEKKNSSKMKVVMMMVCRGLLLFPVGLCVACSLGLAACDDSHESAGGENGATGAAAAAAAAAEGVPATAAAAFVSLHRFPPPFLRHILDHSAVAGGVGGGGVSTGTRGSRVPGDSHHHHHNNNNNHHRHHVRYMRALYRREADEDGRPRGGPSAIPSNTARLIPPTRLGRAPGDPAATAEVVTFDLRAVPRGELVLRAALVYPGDAHGRSACSLRMLPRNSVGADHGASEPAEDPEASGGDPSLDPDLNPNREMMSRPSADPSRNPQLKPKPDLDSNPDLAQNLTANPIPDSNPDVPPKLNAETTPLSNGDLVSDHELEAPAMVSLGEWFEVDVTGPVSRLLNHPGSLSPTTTTSSTLPALRVAWSCAPVPRRAPVPPFLLLYSDDLLGVAAAAALSRLPPARDEKSEELELPSPGFLGDIPGSLEGDHHDHHPAWRLAGSRVGQSVDTLWWKKQKKLKSSMFNEEKKRRRKIATMTDTATATALKPSYRSGPWACSKGLWWAPCPSGTPRSAPGADGSRARRRVVRSLPKGVNPHETPNGRQTSSTSSSSSSLAPSPQKQQQRQQQRQQWLSARGYSGAYRHGCRLHNLSVNFGDLGWDRWIIAPHRYEAGFCRGECARGLLHALGAPNHAIVCTIVEEARPGLGAGKASCVPSHYGAISVLVQEPGGSIAYKLYDGMTALGCTCR
ncbi:unnamed protein product [Lampetra fluviatilis]